MVDIPHPLTPYKPVVAAFDFDGTVTTADTLLMFLYYIQGRLRTWAKFVALVPVFIAGGLGFITRDRMKEKILHAFLGQMDVTFLKKQGEEFASHRIPPVVRPEALARIRWHQQQGHRCIIVSASLDVYLDPWANKVGINTVLSCILEMNQNLQVTGNLVGGNCWGQEKVNRLQKLLGPRDGYILYAYGDTRGDRELLAFADYAYYREMPPTV